MNYFGKNPTPGQKIAYVNNRLGNKGVENQQGTTRIIYDSLPIDGRTEFRFFEGCGSRNYPQTNLTQNKLEVAEAMVIQRASLSVLTIVSGAVTLVESVLTAGALTRAAVYGSGEFQFLIANNRVVKPMPLIAWDPEFNKSAQYGAITGGSYNNYRFMTEISVPPLLEFVAAIRTTTLAAATNKFLRLTIEGVGAITNVKQNL